MKFIKNAEVKFYVNEEKKTVTCIIYKDGVYVSDSSYIKMKWPPYKRAQEIELLPYSPDIKVSATSYCSSDDTFDKVKGKRIAMKKARIKFYKAYLNIITENLNIMEREANLLVEAGCKCNELLGDAYESLDNYLEEIYPIKDTKYDI